MRDFLDSVLIVVLVNLIMGVGIFIGWDSRTKHRTNQPIKPTITITNVDGVVDTTYTYTFE